VAIGVARKDQIVATLVSLNATLVSFAPKLFVTLKSESTASAKTDG
jgi:hypothetical protein